MSVQFPYSLPCIFAAILCAFTLVFSFFYLSETLQYVGPATITEELEMDDLTDADVESVPLVSLGMQGMFRSEYIANNCVIIMSTFESALLHW